MLILLLIPVFLARTLFEISHFHQVPSNGPTPHNPMYFFPYGENLFLNDTQPYISECNSLILNSSSFKLYDLSFPSSLNFKALAFFKPTFKVPTDQYLVFKTKMSAIQTGVDSIAMQNLYGSQVLDPDSDPRLALGAFATFDFTQNLRFCIALTNKEIYVNFGSPLPATQNHFVPVATRNSPFQEHELLIAFDPVGKTVIYEVDGVVVYRLYTVGFTASRQFLVSELSGLIEGYQYPTDITAGYVLASQLDSYSPCNVQVQSGNQRVCVFPLNESALAPIYPEDEYVNPRNGVEPATFVVPYPPTESQALFGQGAILSAKYAKVITVDYEESHSKVKFSDEE